MSLLCRRARSSCSPFPRSTAPASPVGTPSSSTPTALAGTVSCRTASATASTMPVPSSAPPANWPKRCTPPCRFGRWNAALPATRPSRPNAGIAASPIRSASSSLLAAPSTLIPFSIGFPPIAGPVASASGCPSTSPPARWATSASGINPSPHLSPTASAPAPPSTSPSATASASCSSATATAPASAPWTGVSPSSSARTNLGIPAPEPC